MEEQHIQLPAEDSPKTADTNPETTYDIAVMFKCAAPGCEKRHAMTDPKIVNVALNGAVVVLQCPVCHAQQTIKPSWAKEESRIIKPGDSINRHQRRTVEALARHAR
jgi:hypothetical protein